MTLKEIKEKLNEVVALVPERNGKPFGEDAKLDAIIDYLKDSVKIWKDNSEAEKSDSPTTLKIEDHPEYKKLKEDYDIQSRQSEKKNNKIKELNDVISTFENSQTAVNSDAEELLKAYGINSDSSELEKLTTGFDILINRAGNERVRLFTEVALNNLASFTHDEKTTVEYLKEKLKTVGTEKVEGKLNVAKKVALKDK